MSNFSPLSFALTLIKAHHVIYIVGAAVGMVWAPQAKYISTPGNTKFLMTTSLTNLEPLSAAPRFAGIVIMLVICVTANCTKPRSSRTGRHSAQGSISFVGQYGNNLNIHTLLMERWRRGLEWALGSSCFRRL